MRKRLCEGGGVPFRTAYSEIFRLEMTHSIQGYLLLENPAITNRYPRICNYVLGKGSSASAGSIPQWWQGLAGTTTPKHWNTNTNTNTNTILLNTALEVKPCNRHSPVCGAGPGEKPCYATIQATNLQTPVAENRSSCEELQQTLISADFF